MKIVIDIPEEDWKFLKESDGCRWSRAIIEGVANGTPLPKNHVIAEWHPIESLEEIPLEKSLLVCDCDGKIELGYAVRYKARFHDGSDDIRVSDWGGDRIKGIVAWMDLPPYAEAERR